MNAELNSENQSVTCVIEYLHRVSASYDLLDNQQRIPHTFAFRGQANASWELESSAERRLRLTHTLSEQVTNEAFLKYHQDLTERCRKYGLARQNGDILNDLELLANLQHHGAATCLIDFTRSALIALWFACEDSKQDGKIFVVNIVEPSKFIEVTADDIAGHSIEEILNFDTRMATSDEADSSIDYNLRGQIEDRPRFWHWSPSSLNERIAAQHSLFIFAPLSSGRPPCSEIVIDAASKMKIRRELRRLHDVSEQALFPDFVGFAHNERHDAPYYGISSSDHFGYGIEAAQRGNLSQAIDHFTEAIQLDPHDWLAHCHRGRAFIGSLQWDRAIEDFTRAVSISPDSGVPFAERGRGYLVVEDWDHAHRDAAKAIDLNPDYTDAYTIRGFAFWAKGDYVNALMDIEKALELDESEITAYEGRGRMLLEMGDFDGALQDYSRAIALDGKSALSYFGRADTHLRQRNFDNALQDFNKAIELDEGMAYAYTGRGEVYSEKGLFESAIQDFSKAIALTGGKEERTIWGIPPFQSRAQAYKELGKFEEAVVDYSRAIELNPDNHALYAFRAITNGMLGNGDSAVQDLNRAIELSPDNDTLFQVRSQIHQQLGNLDDAVRDITKAVILRPQFPRHFYRRALYRLCQEEWDLARADFDVSKAHGLDIPTTFLEEAGDPIAVELAELKMPDDIERILLQRE